MSYWRCELCDIGVPSSYQKEQHLAGSKHAASLQYFNNKNRSAIITNTILNRESNAALRSFKLLYARDTSTAITKAVAELSSRVKNRFKTIITVTFDEDTQRIHFLFPYDSDFMNLIKTHIQGRTWNSIYRRWEAPVTSAGDVATLCKALDIPLPEELESMTTQQREITINVIDGDERAQVDFTYDAAVVLAIKKLNPINRNYHDTGEHKFWTVDVTCLSDLVHHFLEDLKDLKIPKELVEVIKEIEEKLSSFENKESNTNVINTNEPSPKKHKPGSNTDQSSFTIDLTGDTDVGTIVNIINKSGYIMNVTNSATSPNQSPTKTRGGRTKHPVTSPAKSPFNTATGSEPAPQHIVNVNPVTRANEPKAARLYSDNSNSEDEMATTNVDSSSISSDSPPFSPNVSPLKRKLSELTTTSPSKYKTPFFDEISGRIKWPECEECGKTKDPKKQHHCRFFGQYKCTKCGHTWASAYAWKGEKQECRDCFTMTSPYQLSKLQKRPDDDLDSYFGRGPHESSLCSMCKKLGRPCNYSLY